MNGNRNWKHELVESMSTLEWALDRHFHGGTVRVNGWEMRVEDAVEALQRHIAQIERTEDAHTAWLEEATAERREFGGEISQLLAKLRMFIAGTVGATSPRMCEFGFKPVTPHEPPAETSTPSEPARDHDGAEERPTDERG
jgi:hypothetical protein